MPKPIQSAEWQLSGRDIAHDPKARRCTSGSPRLATLQFGCPLQGSYSFGGGSPIHSSASGRDRPTGTWRLPQDHGSFLPAPQIAANDVSGGSIGGRNGGVGVGSGVGGSGSRLCFADSIARDDLLAGHARRRGSGMDSVGNPRFQGWEGRCSAGSRSGGLSEPKVGRGNDRPFG